MHKITLLILALFGALFTGCEEKKPDQTSLPVEDTTEVISVPEQNKTNETVIRPFQTTIDSQQKIDSASETSKQDEFELTDIQGKKYQVKLEEKDLIFQTPKKPIVLLQLFSTWCAPCLGEINYLNDLHTSNQDDLFIAALLTRDTITKADLKTFIQTHKIQYTILESSPGVDTAQGIAQELGYTALFPIPLLILYVEGKYYTHYEGSVPVEMVKYDIKQAQRQLNE